jgi:RNA methyltransferase, TrmH family
MKGSSGTIRDRDLKAEGLIILEGAFLVERGIRSGLAFTQLSCVPDAQARWRASAPDGCQLCVLPEAELGALIGYPFHRGVFALARRPEILEAVNLKDGGSRLPEGDLLCLWQVTDPDNLGALLRSGAALGAQAAVLGPGCADPFYPKALRASMGAPLSLPVFTAGVEDLAALCAPPRTGIAAALGGSPLGGTSLVRAEAPQRGGNSLFLGNEGWGLPAEVLEACRIKIEIPMSGKTDSLNVAAAGAILMWELFGKGAVRAAESPPSQE